MSESYNHKEVEEKWLKVWTDNRMFWETDKGLVTGGREAETAEKIYLLYAFAYPSGAGLHVGHVEPKTALDILARYYRMQGKKVFFPVGWDAFGLPAENYAIKTGVPPAVTTQEAIKTFERQVKRLAISYDWACEIATSHPEYYKWTQWLFLRFYDKGLAYKAMGKVNWCPSCQTVLANEQVVSGKCERCGTEVVQKAMEQWYFKITQYKDELIEGLKQVDWPKPTKDQQINWIGKQEGVKVGFKIKGWEATPEFADNNIINCFTTRVDTIYGVTFIVISPEKAMDLQARGWQPDMKAANYINLSMHRTEEERRVGEREKTGVNSGLLAINPVNGREVPVYIADYVLAGYGTGAVMGVPAHDQRDHDFAAKMGLPIIKVIEAGGEETDKEATAEYGKLINSDDFNGLTSQAAMDQIPAKIPELMQKTTMYKLRDWLISRQRYWGAPIPIVYDPEGKPHPVKAEHLPWLLPTDVEFKPTGKSPLTYSKEFLERTQRLYGPGWRPEYDTMDTFVDSSWYYLRFADARNTQEFASIGALKKWLPVNFYMIGPEHIVLHLLYSRFFTKFLRDEGILNFDEPFLKMRHQGMILGPDHRKMSKSKGNVITPDEIIEQFGADTLRLYEMFMGPIDADKPWDPRAVNGIYRFLQRLWKLMGQDTTAENEPKELRQKLVETMEKVGEDIPKLKFNTAIASLMELTNAWEVAVKSGQGLSREDKQNLVLVLAPLAPYMAEELWQRLKDQSQEHSSRDQNNLDPGESDPGIDVSQSVHWQAWPAVKALSVGTKSILVVIQVNGKLRWSLSIEPERWQSISDNKLKDEVVALAQQDQRVKKWLAGNTVRQVIWVAPKDKRQGLVNFVIG